MEMNAMLTPSELVLLNGEKFAPAQRFGVKLLHTDTKVDTHALVRAMLTAALLANEQSGNVSLAVRKESALFGLLHPERMYVQLGTSPTGWPPGSLESAICSLATQLASRRRNQVKPILYDWIGRDSSNPWHDVVEKVENEMARRGMLDVSTKKVLKVFRHSDFVRPERTTNLAAQQPIEPIQQLLAACQENRSDTWKRLQREIDGAVNGRKESSNDGPDLDVN